MDAAVTGVAMAALVADGILAGLSLDKVTVQLPARRRTRVRESFDYSSYHRIGRWLIRIAGWPERNQRAIAQTLLRLRAAVEDRTGMIF